MALDVETYFLVTVTPEGGFVTYTKMPEEELNAARQATTLDVFSCAKQIVQEVEQSILVDRIVNSLVSVLTPPQEESVSDKVKDALKSRKVQDALKEQGIDPESITVAE